MIKKLEPKPVFDNFQFAGGERGYLYAVEEWADKLHAHHIEETTSLVQKLEKERARVDELLRKNTQLVNEKREFSYQARDQKVLNELLVRELAELKDPLYIYNTPGAQEAVRKLFNSTPEELAEAAVMAARQDRLAERDMCKWCTNLPAPNDNVCTSCRESMRKMSSFPTRTEAEQAKLDDPDSP